MNTTTNNSPKRDRLTEEQLVSMNKILSPFMVRGLLNYRGDAKKGLNLAIRYISTTNADGSLNETSSIYILGKILQKRLNDYFYDHNPISYHQARYDIDQLCDWRTLRRIQHEDTFCFCTDCVDKYNLNCAPRVYELNIAHLIKN